MADPQGTFAWLVEEIEPTGTVSDSSDWPPGSPLYWCASGWTHDPCKAVRLARREDAVTIVDLFRRRPSWPARRYEVREHGFAPMEPPMADPVCSTCNDTHRMTLGDSEVMCTRCPVPCERCRSRGPGRAGGPYCAITPCPCTCHGMCADRDSDLTDPELALYAAGTDDSVTSRMARELVRLRAAHAFSEAADEHKSRVISELAAEVDRNRATMQRLETWVEHMEAHPHHGIGLRDFAAGLRNRLKGDNNG